MKGVDQAQIMVLRDYLELTKPRITLLILICTAVGYWFGCGALFH